MGNIWKIYSKTIKKTRKKDEEKSKIIPLKLPTRILNNVMNRIQTKSPKSKQKQMFFFVFKQTNKRIEVMYHQWTVSDCCLLKIKRPFTLRLFVSEVMLTLKIQTFRFNTLHSNTDTTDDNITLTYTDVHHKANREWKSEWKKRSWLAHF